MNVEIETIKTLAKKLASIKIKKYSSLTEIKEDFDSIASELIDSDDIEVIDTLKNSSKYFNFLTEEDFKTNDRQKINESIALISRFTLELNSILVKWRKEHGQL